MSAERGAGTPPNSKLQAQINYTAKANNDLVLASASGIWPQILIAQGIPEYCLSGKHSPCPIHAGSDGFRFTDEGRGCWVCATCTNGKFKDGFELIALYKGIPNKEAFKLVATYLNLSGNSPLKNKVKQLNAFTNQLDNRQAEKQEQDQKLLAKKKVFAGEHAEKLLAQCNRKPHQYLIKKGINQPVLVNTKPYKLLYQKLNSATGKQEDKEQTVYAGALVIPIYDLNDNNRLIGAQFINANGSRAYLAGTPIADGTHLLKSDDNLPYVGVCEGYASSLSVFMATNASVIVAFDANGLESKAERLKASFPGKFLAFFGDHDSNNVGQKAAHAAALKTNGLVVIPPILGQDWNDYHQAHGIGATKAEIDRQLLQLKAEQSITKDVDIMSTKNNVITTLLDNLKSNDLVPRGNFPYLSEKGNLLNVPENIECLLDHYKIKVRFNLVSKRIEITVPDKKYSKTNESEVKLSDIAALCVKNSVPKVDLERWMLLIADKNRYSPAVEWINSKPWDGISRIEQFTNTVVANNPELAKVLIYRWMLGAVAAAFSENGISLPGVLVFQGEQGVGKTGWFKALVPTTHQSLIVDGVILDPRTKDSIIGCTSHWLAELGELDGTFNKSDLAALKAWLLKSIDYIRMPYARTESTVPRNTAFYGSVNNAQYLVDETGNRRWWSVSVKTINWKHSIDMQQVWAEFKTLLDASESYYLNEGESKLLNAENELFETVDPMEEMILNRFRWDEKERNRKLTACEVLKLIGFDLTNHNAKSIGKRCGNILRKLTGDIPKPSNGKKLFNLPRQKPEQELSPDYD